MISGKENDNHLFLVSDSKIENQISSVFNISPVDIEIRDFKLKWQYNPYMLGEKDVYQIVSLTRDTIVFADGTVWIRQS